MVLRNSINWNGPYESPSQLHQGIHRREQGEGGNPGVDAEQDGEAGVGDKVRYLACPVFLP